MPYVTSIERAGIAKGRRKGHQEGHQEGRQIGQREEEIRILRRQLQHRFGELPAWVEKRLEGGSASDLEHWSDRVLDAVILEDVFA